jgi:superfamily I DNA/RNA helicase
VYSAYLRTGGGIQNYDIHFYTNEDEQRDKLIQWLREFRTQGYKPSEITVLSFRGIENSIGFRLAAEGFKLRPAWQQSNDSTSFASVHAFKGLENKVIILTDVALRQADFHRDLFYTGMTRATESVRILCEDASQDTLTQWLMGKADHD